MEQSRTDLRQRVLEKFPSISETVLDALLSGIDRESLDIYMAGSSREEREIARMNLVGTLRSLGFTITGGRGGGRIYRIWRWEEPKPKTTVAEWSDEDRESLAQVQSDPVELLDFAYAGLKIRDSIDAGIADAESHESGPLELFSYELGASSTQGFWTEGRRGIVIQRFVNRPVFRIRPFTMSDDEIVDLAQRLSKLSVRPIQIIDVNKATARRLLEAFPIRPSVTKNRQSILSTQKAVDFSSSVFNKRAQSMIRKNDRETTFVRLLSGGEAACQVIDEWRVAAESKQRQLSITRDYVAAEIDAPKFLFLGLRNDIPVSLHILEQLTPTMCSQIVEKSLNYRGVLGGQPGTTDWNLFATSRALLEMGILEINMGHIFGGTFGLAEHKLKIQSREVESWIVNTGLGRTERGSGSDSTFFN